MYLRVSAIILTLFVGILYCEESQNVATNSTTHYISASLSKFVRSLSRPGAFIKEAHAAFGDELKSTEVSPCPSGEEGLQCRRMEARRGADECVHGATCSRCRECEDALEWPRCCKRHFLCCSNLAAACQRCDQPHLAPFCVKRFKRCFQ